MRPSHHNFINEIQLQLRTNLTHFVTFIHSWVLLTGWHRMPWVKSAKNVCKCAAIDFFSSSQFILVLVVRAFVVCVVVLLSWRLFWYDCLPLIQSDSESIILYNIFKVDPAPEFSYWTYVYVWSDGGVFLLFLALIHSFGTLIGKTRCLWMFTDGFISLWLVVFRFFVFFFFRYKVITILGFDGGLLLSSDDGIKLKICFYEFKQS